MGMASCTGDDDERLMVSVGECPRWRDLPHARTLDAWCTGGPKRMQLLTTILLLVLPLPV